MGVFAALEVLGTPAILLVQRVGAYLTVIAPPWQARGNWGWPAARRERAHEGNNADLVGNFQLVKSDNKCLSEA